MCTANICFKVAILVTVIVGVVLLFQYWCDYCCRGECCCVIIGIVTTVAVSTDVVVITVNDVMSVADDITVVIYSVV